VKIGAFIVNVCYMFIEKYYNSNKCIIFVYTIKKETIMKATNNTVIDNFILETTLINPIEKIILQLKNGEFRDCDIKWLNAKLQKFIDFAAKTLDINVIIHGKLHSDTFIILNNYALGHYENRFNTLLNYFKTL